jgi:hypothetical protein
MRALLVNLSRTLVGTGSPASLSSAGFDVAVFAPENSIFHRSGRVTQRFLIDTQAETRIHELANRLVRSLILWKPDLVVPQDAAAFQILAMISEDASAESDEALAAIQSLRRSIGGRHLSGRAAYRKFLHETLQQLKLPLLEAIETGKTEEAQAFAHKVGAPVVLKSERTQNGQGVVVCETPQALAEACLRYPLEEGGYWQVQRYLGGAVFRCSFSSWNGRVLASFVGEQLHSRYDNPFAAPTVVRLTDRVQISDTVARLVKHWGMSGYAGFDFLYDPERDVFCAIDFNPRINSLSHLGWLGGLDLTAALAAEISQNPSETGPPTPDGQRIATIFPYEWLRDPSSPYLKSCASDAPWDDPQLMKAVVEEAIGMEMRGKER